MGLLWRSGRFLAYDMLSTLFFLGVYALTKSIPLSAGLGIATALGQIGVEIARRRPVHTMQWVSLAVVISSGAGAIVLHDVRVILIKPSLIYACIGAAMLKPGWMERYLPEEAKTWVADVADRWGFVWAGLMFVSAVLNLALAFALSFAMWAVVMSAWATGSKIVLFLVQFTTMRWIGRQRRLAAEEARLAAGETALA